MSTSDGSRHLEVERKFVLDPDAELPPLAGLVEIGEAREHRMRAVYLDTTDLLLIRSGITLRRREGGSDEGWHLKLPATEDARWELHEPLTDGPGRWRVPETLVEALAGRLGPGWTDRTDPERGLVPVAVLKTYRLEVGLTDGDGRVVALLSDDTVSAEPGGSTWRELEVELAGAGADGAGRSHGTGGGSGRGGLLEAVSERFTEHGLEPAELPSKLSRALGDRPELAAQGQGPTSEDSAADVLRVYLAEQVAVIRGREAGLREDAPEAVHKTRVACRRLRSALRTFRRLLDREVTDPLRDEIKWLGEVLGGPRDAEVIKAELLEELTELPEDQVEGAVRERVTSELDRRHAETHAALVEVMDGERYAELVDRLVELVADTPWRGRARKRAAKVLPPLVDKAVERARAEWEAAQVAEGDERMHLLHEARKRAKAVRYAWEALAPAFGDDAAEQATSWEKVTETLGAVQDSVVAIERLRQLMAVAEEAGESVHTYGVLIGMQLGARRPSTKAGEAALAAALG